MRNQLPPTRLDLDCQRLADLLGAKGYDVIWRRSDAAEISVKGEVYELNDRGTVFFPGCPQGVALRDLEGIARGGQQDPQAQKLAALVADFLN